MSSLDSSSTYDEIQASYADNASYDEDSSLVKCKAFITACRLLLIKIPSLVRSGQRHEVQMDVGQISAELERARQWQVASAPNVAASNVIGISFADFRGNS